MIFYDYWRSSSAWRVRIALHWKGLAFERRVVNLAAGEQHQAEFRAVNRMGQAPVLVVDDDGTPRALTQSQAILAYLDDRFPAPPLLPETVWERARAREVAELVTSGIQPHQNLAGLQYLRQLGLPDPSPIPSHHIAKGLAAIETIALETAGTFVVGGAPSIADVCLVPQLYSARRFGVDVTPYPTLLRVEAACAALPAFRAAHADAQSDAVRSTG
jgi:maleylpyruvate isomerase